MYRAMTNEEFNIYNNVDVYNYNIKNLKKNVKFFERKETFNEVELKNVKSELQFEEKAYADFKKYLETDAFNNLEFVKEVIKLDADIFNLIPRKFQEDKEICKELLNINGKVLQFVNEDFKKDKEIVIAAINNYPINIQYASNEIKNDEEIARMVVCKFYQGDFLKYFSEELRNNKDFILDAVKFDGKALEWVSEELKNDKDVVLKAIENYPIVIQYASDELRNDKEIILRVTEQYPWD